MQEDFDVRARFERRHNLMQEKVDAILADRAGLRRERGLSVTHRTLSDHVVPRPYAGKKSRRTHARTWV